MASPLRVPEGYSIACLDTSVHERDGFSCGVAALDDFLCTRAAQNESKNLSRTHVLIDTASAPIKGKARIVGYVTLATAELQISNAPALAKITKHASLPALVLARMAIDGRYKGKHLGEFLLNFTLHAAWQISLNVGCYAVLVDAKDEAVKQFYTKYGFLELPDRPLRLYLPTATFAALFDGD